MTRVVINELWPRVRYFRAWLWADWMRPASKPLIVTFCRGREATFNHDPEQANATKQQGKSRVVGIERTDGRLKHRRCRRESFFQLGRVHVCRVRPLKGRKDNVPDWPWRTSYALPHDLSSNTMFSTGRWMLHLQLAELVRSPDVACTVLHPDVTAPPSG